MMVAVANTAAATMPVDVTVVAVVNVVAAETADTRALVATGVVTTLKGSNLNGAPKAAHAATANPPLGPTTNVGTHTVVATAAPVSSRAALAATAADSVTVPPAVAPPGDADEPPTPALIAAGLAAGCVAYRHFWCKLTALKRLSQARRRPLKAVLFVLLALQWVLGLQLQAAGAVESVVTATVHGMVHKSRVSFTPIHAVGVTLADRASQPDCPNHSTPHDCCHANACQCQCLYTPGTIAFPALAQVATSIAVPTLATTQFVAPRVDEFLRPPIA